MKRSLSLLSIGLSCIVIVTSIVINLNIANEYNQSEGKTRALFGLIDMKFDYKYYLIILSISSLIISFITKKGSENVWHWRAALAFSLISFLIVIFRLWPIFI